MQRRIDATADGGSQFDSSSPPAVDITATSATAVPSIGSAAAAAAAATTAADGTAATAVGDHEAVRTTEDDHDVEAQQNDELSRLAEADTAIIAQAWMAKRREQIHGGPSSTTTAVDVDTLSHWPNQNNLTKSNTTTYPQSADYLSTRRVNNNHSRISPYHEHDAESSLSSWSIRTDKTPIVNNRMPGAMRPRLPPRLILGGAGGPLSTTTLPSSSSFPLDHQALHQPNNPAVPPTQPLPVRGHDLSCRDVFDYSKWHGKVCVCFCFCSFFCRNSALAVANLFVDVIVANPMNGVRCG
jgi:hypothetical protein